MTEKQGVEKLKKLVSALDDLVALGEDVMADGKLDMMDVVHVGKVAPIVQALYDAWKAKEEMVLEAKDLSWDEIKELVEEAID